MHQTVLGEYQHVAVPDSDLLKRFAETEAAIASRSALIWGEHCSECVMPSCYSTCAFYTPRHDLKCRRFDEGLQPIRAEGDFRTSGMRISFRKWGKLEAASRPSALSAGRIAAMRTADAAFTGFLGLAPLPDHIQDIMASAWNRTKGHFASRGGKPTQFDAFLVECLSETRSTCGFTLSVKPATATGRYFQLHFALKPGYNRIEVAIADIQQSVDLSEPVLVQIEPIETPGDNAFIFGCLDFVAFTKGRKAGPQPAPLAGSVGTNSNDPPKPAAKVKCVIWDLDNTLWRGTLIEDGIDNLVLNSEALRVILELDQRGVLQSIASKNNPEDALAGLERFGLAEYFLAPQIGWVPKSAGISEIARRLNIHKNTFLFVDDQPFERAEVLSAHPDVRVVPETQIGELLLLRELDTPVTDEGRNRRAMYKVEEKREAAFQVTGTSFVDFLRSCALELTIGDVTDSNINRVFELSQRTNQLNFAGKASSRKDVEDLLGGGAHNKVGLVLSCSDKFGDYGVIGFAIVDVEHFHVENFFMSCRVQHKKVDHAFFAWLIGRAMKRGLNSVSTVFRFSGRNQSAKQVLTEMAFSPSEDAEVYVSPRLEDLPEADVVRVIDETRPDIDVPQRALAG